MLSGSAFLLRTQAELGCVRALGGFSPAKGVYAPLHIKDFCFSSPLGHQEGRETLAEGAPQPQRHVSSKRHSGFVLVPPNMLRGLESSLYP